MSIFDVDAGHWDTNEVEGDAFMAKDVKGKDKMIVPAVPAVVLTDPKFPHNIGQSIRALSCFEVKQLWWSGQRVMKSLQGMDRIPREERMRGYADVSVVHHDRPLECFEKINATPVAVEFRENSEDLVDFIHPENAVYVFGPEDGSIDQGTLRNCHRFVKIPTKHCTNLSAAVYLILYDRLAKKRLAEQSNKFFVDLSDVRAKSNY